MMVARWAVVGSALLGYASGANGQEQHIKIAKERPVLAVDTTRQQVVTFSTFEVRLSTFSIGAYANLSDTAVVAHMTAGDSLEISIANIAALKATELRVRDYAGILSSEHEAQLANMAHVIENGHIAPVALANDPEGARLKEMLAWLDSAPASAAWDAAFLRFQVAHHQNEIAVVNANIKNKHGDDLAEHLRRSLLALAKHRDLARSLATTLGVSLP